jgi:glyoxylase-like metal-dependent hydrolase (beta-lactamase superfamily II)
VSDAPHPTPPTDPRATWSLPPFGELPRVARLDEVTTRVLAPNPSPMTLDGTNTYVISAPGSSAALIVDPGPDDDAHLATVRDVLADLDVEVQGIFVTHHHLDHAEAAKDWGRRFDVEVLASS